jgi:choice-of-anchor A domain-containing protein
MKLMGMGRRAVSIWIAVIGLCVAAGASGASLYEDTLPDGEINTGSASVFTVLTSSSDMLKGGSVIQGNFGIEQGKLTLSGVGTKVLGARYSDDPLVESALMDAQSLSDAASMEPVTSRYASLTSVNLNHSSLTITGGANEKVVLRLTDFVLTNNSIFTLSGTATTSFIINVTDTFSLRSNSHISLVNVPASNVLFNILGTGSTVVLRGGSTLPGTLLALNRKVRIRRSEVDGRVIANQVNISRHSSVLTATRNP